MATPFARPRSLYGDPAAERGLYDAGKPTSVTPPQLPGDLSAPTASMAPSGPVAPSLYNANPDWGSMSDAQTAATKTAMQSAQQAYRPTGDGGSPMSSSANYAQKLQDDYHASLDAAYGDSWRTGNPVPLAGRQINSTYTAAPSSAPGAFQVGPGNRPAPTTSAPAAAPAPAGSTAPAPAPSSSPTTTAQQTVSPLSTSGGTKIAAGSPQMAQMLMALDFSDANATASVRKVWELMQANGWTPEQVGDVFGYSGDLIRQTLERHGVNLNAISSTSGTAPGVTIPEASQVTGYQGQNLMTATSTAPQAVTATPWNVDDKQTVQGQIDRIIERNSPLMQQAETRGLQQANARGLLNSSMAVQAGQAALYDAAMPIAQQDAATHASSGQFNAAQGTDVSKFNTTMSTQNNQFNASEENKVRMFELQNDADIAKFNASESNALKKLGMDSETKLQLANIEAGYKTLMQTQAGAADLYKQTIQNIAAILGNKDLDEDGKRKAIDNLIAMLNNGMGLIGQIGNVDLGDLLQFGGDIAAPNANAPAAAPPPQAPPPSGWTNPEFIGA